MKLSDVKKYQNLFDLCNNLVPAKDLYLLDIYKEYLLLLLKRGLHQKHTHHQSFNLLYKAISHSWSSQTLLGKLQQEFIKRNFSLSLLLEALDGCNWLYKNSHEISFQKATPILLQIISPLSRLIAVINNQTPPLYQPLSDMLFVNLALSLENDEDIRKILQFSHILFDKKDLPKYLPQMLSESNHVMNAASGFIFRIKLGYTLGLLNIIYTTSQNKKTFKNIGFYTKNKAFFKGLWYTLTMKNRTNSTIRI